MKASSPTPYPELNVVLAEFVARLQSTLCGNFLAAYLAGSFAVGDFDEHSDVDFLVVIEHDLSEAEVEVLQEMHGLIHGMESGWARHLEGSYFPKVILNDPAAVRTEKLWYLDNGSRMLIRSLHDNQWVERWMIYHHGIVLFGPPAHVLFAQLPPGALQREVSRTMHDWGNEMLKEPGKISSCWYQSFAVISYCRMLQTMETGTIQSKASGVRWALENLDHEWSNLIQRAWDERPDSGAKCRIPADPDLRAATLKFIRIAIDRIPNQSPNT